MQDWVNWQPPADIEIDGARNVAPQEPVPPVGPDTDLLLLVNGNAPGVDLVPQLIPDYSMGSNNTPIPAKGVAGIGPQPGTRNNEFENLGTVILPGWQRYLEMGGQRQVGILPRTVPVITNELWDANFVLNPSIEVT